VGTEPIEGYDNNCKVLLKTMQQVMHGGQYQKLKICPGLKRLQCELSPFQRKKLLSVIVRAVFV
jgi:hypothetical protein